MSASGERSPSEESDESGGESDNHSQAFFPLQRVELDSGRCLSQDHCPLFALLPPEIRNTIFAYVLKHDEDPSRRYTPETYYARPDFAAPRRCDAALLRTCQLVYREAWFWPWSNLEHVFFLTGTHIERRPDNVGDNESTVEAMTRSLLNIHATRPTSIDIPSVRVFAQLCELEPGEHLGRILSMPHFHPRVFTITLRHTDWWHWENDEPLRIAGQFVARCAFPASVEQIRLELESIDRRAKQIDHVATQMAERWRFRRQDGAVLTTPVKDATAAAREGEIRRWSGTSTFSGYRWIDDEVAPETLSYYVRTVVFTPVDIPGPSECRTRLLAYDINVPDAVDRPEYDLDIQVGAEFVQQRTDGGFVSVLELERAGIPAGTPGDEVRRRVEEWRLTEPFQARTRRFGRRAARAIGHPPI